MHKDPLTSEMMSPDSQNHGNAIQLCPVDTHEFILKVGFWVFALTTISLEVTAKAYITGICERFELCTGEPMQPV